MNNNEIFGYKPFNICEGHFHCSYKFKVQDSVQIYRNIFEFYGYDKGALMVYLHDVDQDFLADNAKALYIKDVFNKAEPTRRLYACGSLYHNFDERDTADGYLEQAETMYSLGFDGFKLLEGKPALRKKLARRLDDPIFDKFYAYAEEMGLPVTLHVADPPSFWDINKIMPYALKVGWFCDETFPRFKEFHYETEGILKKFPRLKLTLAHFFFTSADYDYAVYLMETYPNVYLDLTPNGEMFADFTKRVANWHDFFVKYADRIIYGTDTYNQELLANIDDYKNSYIGHRINLVRRAIEGVEPFIDESYGNIVPLTLNNTTLNKIYRENFIKLYGDVRDVNDANTAEYTFDLLTKFMSGEYTNKNAERDALDIENLKTIYDYFLTSDMVTN